MHRQLRSPEQSLFLRLLVFAFCETHSDYLFLRPGFKTEQATHKFLRRGRETEKDCRGDRADSSKFVLRPSRSETTKAGASLPFPLFRSIRLERV